MRSFDRSSYDKFIDYLKENSDEDYRKFNEKIIPEMGAAFGIRAPIIKKIAGELAKGENVKEMVDILHEKDSYEEKLLEGLLTSKLKLEKSKDMFEYVDRYILRINNWALCDSFVSNLRKLVCSNREEFYNKIKNEYIISSNPWEIRFGLILVNNYFTDEEYLEEVFNMIENIKNDHYYVKMGIAWLVSTLYFTNKKKVIDFIISGRMDKWCTNKSIQKIIESLKTSKEEKDYLRTLRIK